MSGGEYSKEKRNKVNRLLKRGRYDFETIHSIIDETPVLHVSFIPVDPSEDPFPTTLPMLGCTGDFAEQGSSASEAAQHVYLHGYVSSRLMRLGAAEGTPVCVAASLMDGVVLALAPFHNSCNYRSAVVHGYAHVVTDEAEKLWALERITDSIAPGRWATSRSQPTKVELQTTAVLRVEVASASAKVRTGSASDDRHDLQNADLIGSTWTGVIPTWTQYGDPVPSGHNKVGKVPPQIQQWVKARNKDGQDKAVEVISVPSK